MTDDAKKACLIYVPETAGRVPAAKSQLEQQGYMVCEAEASSADAVEDHEAQLPQAVLACIQEAELCVFLLPEEEANDGCLAAGAGAAQASETRMIGVYSGQRTIFPQALDEHAESIVREEGESLPDAISGIPIWEKPDGQRVPDREIVRVRCQ